MCVFNRIKQALGIVEQRNYTSTVIDSIFDAATNGSSNARVGATAGLGAVSGFVGRCFAAARVTGPSAITPELLGFIGASLIRHGEAVLWIRVRSGRLELIPVASYDVRGDAYPETWRYQIELQGPSTITRVVARETDVIHPRFSFEAARPWRGVGPLQRASIAGRLSAEVSAALADESSMTRGAVLPMPTRGDGVPELKADLKRLKGRVAFVEAHDSTGYGDSRKTPGSAGWDLKRIGADPPVALVKLADQAFREVVAACGVNPGLVSDSDGTALRESYRQAVHSVVTPLGVLVAAELTEKLGTDIQLDFSRVMSADIQGRARSLRSLTEAGVALPRALELAGFEQ